MSLLTKTKGIKSYVYRNLIAPRWYSWRDRKILEKNLKLRGKYSGNRCFIVASGPSVNNIDLGQLRNEYTFVMTEFDKNPQFDKLLPKFYVIGDSAYFTEGEANYWPTQLKKKSQIMPQNTTMILPLSSKPFIEKYKLFANHPLYYIGTQGIFTNNLPFNIELGQYIPNPKNSVLMCLINAAYMGFSPIYLLGCEHDFLSKNIGFGKSIVYNHSYDHEISKLDSTNEELLKKYWSPKDLYMTYEKNIANVLQLFKNYRFFYKKVTKTHPDIKIYNATPNSFLETFPTINFEDIKF